MINTKRQDSIRLTCLKALSRKVLNRLKRKASISKASSKRKTAKNFCFAFLRIFAPKTPVQMFAYLSSEVLCNIPQVCISTVRKAASTELPQRLDHERSLWKAFSKHRAGKLSARC